MCVFDFRGILQRRVHVSVAVSVRDPLHRFGRGLAERDRSVYALDEVKLLLLP